MKKKKDFETEAGQGNPILMMCTHSCISHKLTFSCTVISPLPSSEYSIVKHDLENQALEDLWEVQGRSGGGPGVLFGVARACASN